MNAFTANHKRINTPQLLFAIIGLASIIAFVHLLNIEENIGLPKLLLLIGGGFLIYLLLPLSYRLPFLFGLTVSGFFLLFEPLDALLLICLGLLLFAVINLPLSVTIRSCILFVLGLYLALSRLNILPFIHQEVIIPVLGGLFMFRSILYLYEVRFLDTSANIWLRLNYFFLLPNLIFLIFPVVDYKTFISNYYKEPAYKNYYRGIRWMANGVFHLFLYRLLYYYLIPSPEEIIDIYDWLQFVIVSYALIVRLAGIFHLSAGVLSLFGFSLPPTFNHYFFANSFNDLWRRINRYWRDFVMKVFYYPIYFKVKKVGTVKALAISILLTFAANWLLHAYQWLWIRGSLLFTWQDVSFWVIFGVAVAINSVYQAKNKKKKKNENDFQLSAAAINSLKIIGVFSFMAFLWSWWTAPSIQVWVGLLHVWKSMGFQDVIQLLMGIAVLVPIGIAIDYFHQRFKKSSDTYWHNGNLQVIIISVLLVLSASVGVPLIKGHLEHSLAMDLTPVVKTVLNAADTDVQFQGYYETMLEDNNLLASPLTELENKRPKSWSKLHETSVQENVPGIITKQLKPNADIRFKEERFRTNAFGLHDLSLNKVVAPNTLRMALLGGSMEMGGGVKAAETYENVLTTYLNNESVFTPYEKVEILNFGISGTHLFQHLARLEQQVLQFKPQVVIYTAHSDEIRRVMSNVYRIHSSGTAIPYSYLNVFLNQLPAEALKNEYVFHIATQDEAWDLISYGLSSIRDASLAIGAVPVWMFVPALDGREKPEENERLFHVADSLAFHTIDLRGFFSGDEPENLILRPWDRHPSVEGHRRIAEKAFQEIKSNEKLIKAINNKYQEND